MPRAKRQESCGCCKVEALIPVDERGQMVLPKEVRERLALWGGDKLALATIERDGAVWRWDRWRKDFSGTPPRSRTEVPCTAIS